METEQAPNALVNHKLALSYWCGVMWLSKRQVRFQSVLGGIFQEWWGNTNTVVLVKLHLELSLQYSSPMSEDR